MRPKTDAERQRAILAAQEADRAAARRREIDRLDRAIRIRSETPATHPESFRQIVFPVHREEIDAEIAVMMRVVRRIGAARTAAQLSGDDEAYRQIDEEGIMIAAIIKEYLDLKKKDGAAGAAESGSLAALRKIREMRR